MKFVLYLAIALSMGAPSQACCWHPGKFSSRLVCREPRCQPRCETIVIVVPPAPTPIPTPIPPKEAPKKEAPKKVGAATTATEALDEVNAIRAKRGLRPYVKDDGLTAAAIGCAEFRASNRIAGHTRNDFQFVPGGSTARAAGCAANGPQHGFMACCVYDGYTYAGAAKVLGADGKLYCHLYVR